MISYTCNNGLLTVKKTPEFDLEKTVLSGQIFRYFKNGSAGYTVLSRDRYAVCSENAENTEILSNDAEYFAKYFDFARDYGIIYESYLDRPV
ncbi:MAG: 8-oxoguanine DNA glycosylase, N-terminal domain-containing protein, partial [Clostridiales bacterium]|nr:8-oxoguanine DNA glycosylase, N-terminal domain-containing protein [Clostridiales bacterium]